MRLAVNRLLAAAVLGLAVVPGRPARAQVDSSARRSAASSTHARVHLRVLGVYDEETGNPIEGADVTDALTGLTSRTTKTGTVALFFADTSWTMVRLKKVGYQPNAFVISTALTDTTPVTATMIRAGHVLAKVVTIGNRAVKLGPADTMPELLRNGFYERRLEGGAPGSAFIDGSKLQGTALVSNARFFGRGICTSNLYIDGAPIRVPPNTGRFLKEGVDALVNSSDVAGIETYEMGDAPIDGAHTVPGAGTLDAAATALENELSSASTSLSGHGCVTLIWLKH
ncbi:MAG TPA: hypothetical protein VHB25_14025 [Gemmatimonadaceae bacterium]|nr:hypothetical protein [Gemmatimonadaceae bacterium]